MIAEAAVEAITLLRRHDLWSSIRLLTNWSPQSKQITKKIASDIKTIIYTHNLSYWDKLLSKVGKD